MRLKKRIKRFHSRWPLAIGGLVVLVLLLSAWQPSITGRATSSASCVDRDGDNPLIASETSVTLNGVTQEFMDKCVANQVLEYTCNGNKVEEKLYSCPCERGYCYINLGSSQ